MKRRTCLALCSGTFVAGGLGLPIAARAAIEWNCYSFCPAATLVGARGMQKIVEGVKQKTNGALNITVNLAGSLPINTTTITQAVSDGLMQMGDDDFYLGNIPIAGILQLPMLFTTTQELLTAMTIMRPYIDRACFLEGPSFDRDGNLYVVDIPFGPDALTKRGEQAAAGVRDPAGERVGVAGP